MDGGQWRPLVVFQTACLHGQGILHRCRPQGHRSMHADSRRQGRNDRRISFLRLLQQPANVQAHGRFYRSNENRHDARNAEGPLTGRFMPERSSDASAQGMPDGSPDAYGTGGRDTAVMMRSSCPPTTSCSRSDRHPHHDAARDLCPQSALTCRLNHSGAFPMARASARHILVDNEAKCNELKQAIENGADFAQVAKENSSCPSSRDGGALGTFGRGEMVREFDEVVFSAP